jgi:hypothetical protein
VFEPVYTVDDYYDGPRSGVAELRGIPHHYECEWDDLRNDFSDTFVLRPANGETLALALERESIWREWESAHLQGLVTDSTHPGRPGQNARYSELETLFKASAIFQLAGAQYRGEFRPCENQENVPEGLMQNLEVEWTAVD